MSPSAVDPSENSRLARVGAAGRDRWLVTKRDFRSRAHSNPLNDGIGFDAPQNPTSFQKSLPELFGKDMDDSSSTCTVNWCDIGCGYGCLLGSLSVAFPDRNMIGFEIRDRVSEFCRKRVGELRAEYDKCSEHGNAGRTEGCNGMDQTRVEQQLQHSYRNVAFLRTNAMRFMPNYFAKASLEKIFFCYPDPHFKKRRHRQRIVSDQLLAEYAYILAPGGVAYFVTDVPDLFTWMKERFERFPLFRQRTSEEIAADPIVPFVRDMTDEAAIVDKSDRSKMDASYVRVELTDG